MIFPISLGPVPSLRSNRFVALPELYGILPPLLADPGVFFTVVIIRVCHNVRRDNEAGE